MAQARPFAVRAYDETTSQGIQNSRRVGRTALHRGIGKEEGPPLLVDARRCERIRWNGRVFEFLAINSSDVNIHLIHDPHIHGPILIERH
jgi:hypothetical protein